jgi:SAM-dependent methyltransferase
MNSEQTGKQRVRVWLRTLKENRRSVVVGPLLRFFVSLYYFHPRERFLNGLNVKFKTGAGIWKRFSFGRSMVQRVFYVCSQETSAGEIMIKLPRGDNQFSCNLIAAIRDDRRFEDYKQLLITLRADPWLAKHCVDVFRVRRDGGYSSEYVEGFNLADLRDELFDSKAMPKHFRDGLAKAIKHLIADLRGYYTQRGELIGDWGLHNLVFSPEKASVVNVDAEGFFSFDKAKWENNLSWIEGYLSDIVEFLQLLDSPSPEDEKTVAVFRILDEVRRSGESYSGIDFLVGYHSLELNGRMYRGQRECSHRLANIPFDFTNKVVVDLGCNSGGMLHALSRIIAQGYGFDFNPKCVNAAQSIKLLKGVSNLQFFTFDLDRDDLSLLPCFIFHKKVDICFLLSVCMWLKRWRMVVQQAAMLANAILFESNGTTEQQAEQVALLRTCFAEVQLLSDSSHDDPLQSARKLYLCSASKLRPVDATGLEYRSNISENTCQLGH